MDERVIVTTAVVRPLSGSSLVDTVRVLLYDHSLSSLGACRSDVNLSFIINVLGSVHVFCFIYVLT